MRCAHGYFFADRGFRSNKHTPFDVTRLNVLPDVAVVELYADISDVAINAYVKAENLHFGRLRNRRLWKHRRPLLRQ